MPVETLHCGLDGGGGALQYSLLAYYSQAASSSIGAASASSSSWCRRGCRLEGGCVEAGGSAADAYGGEVGGIKCRHGNNPRGVVVGCDAPW